jgi:hypothetical protein
VIRLTDINGRTLLINPDQIVQVTQAGTSQAWHGVGANVQTVCDGKWIKVRQSVKAIEKQLASLEDSQ